MPQTQLHRKERSAPTVPQLRRGRPTKEHQAARMSEYLKARAAFVERLEKQRDHLYVVEDGRRFDKVSDGEHAVFFIERSTGTILGVKSDIAPNFRHWFDTVYVAKMWNWGAEGPEGGFWPAPKDPTKYRVTKQYGNYVQYTNARGRPRKVA